MQALNCHSLRHRTALACPSQERSIFGVHKQVGRNSGVKASAIKARWCIDIKYGVKMDAIALVQEWVQNIGTIAGLSAENTSLTSAAIGAPESRLELEVQFDSLAEVEAFWAAIPPAEHKAWSQRAQNFIIDGSPRWELYRTCPIYPGSDSSKAAAAILNAWKAAPSQGIPEAPTSSNPSTSTRAIQSPEGPARWSTTLPSPVPEEAEVDSKPATKIVLDWKGDPMTINPGDKMPLF